MASYSVTCCCRFHFDSKLFDGYLLLLLATVWVGCRLIIGKSYTGSCRSALLVARRPFTCAFFIPVNGVDENNEIVQLGGVVTTMHGYSPLCVPALAFYRLNYPNVKNFPIWNGMVQCKQMIAHFIFAQCCGAYGTVVGLVLDTPPTVIYSSFGVADRENTTVRT